DQQGRSSTGDSGVEKSADLTAGGSGGSATTDRLLWWPLLTSRLPRAAGNFAYSLKWLSRSSSTVSTERQFLLIFPASIAPCMVATQKFANCSTSAVLDKRPAIFSRLKKDSSLVSISSRMRHKP